uniref:Cytochrome P450 family 4 subfamily F member 57 n=1 Tax=Cercocebus atys TaxID=9531 RepID=A0A2K5M1R6_CERAT
MSLLSLPWLGLGQVAASPWLLLLLAGGSWLLARVLAWTYAFYNNYRRLQCFPQPPKRNWFWGHSGREEGLKNLTQLSATYSQGFTIWMAQSGRRTCDWWRIWAAIHVMSTYDGSVPSTSSCHSSTLRSLPSSCRLQDSPIGEPTPAA